jgi:hypothetical protein
VRAKAASFLKLFCCRRRFSSSCDRRASSRTLLPEPQIHSVLDFCPSRGRSVFPHQKHTARDHGSKSLTSVLQFVPPTSWIWPRHRSTHQESFWSLRWIFAWLHFHGRASSTPLVSPLLVFLLHKHAAFYSSSSCWLCCVVV